MATADSNTAHSAPIPSVPLVLDTNQVSFNLSQDKFIELIRLLSAYSDLKDLMDSELPEYTFFTMLNERFSSFVFSLKASDPSATSSVVD